MGKNELMEAMMEKYELKPCPFCGGTDLEFDGAPIHYWIVCNNKECGAGGSGADTEEGAVEKWNTRFVPK